MKRLKILVSLVGMFAVFSFVNASAVEKSVNFSTENEYDGCVFTINEFKNMYETIKKQKKFEKEFFLEIDTIARGVWEPELFGIEGETVYDDTTGKLIECIAPKYPMQGVTRTYEWDDAVDDEMKGEICRDKFLEDIMNNYFSFKEPERFKEKFEGDVNKLNHNRICELIFEDDNNGNVANVNLTLNKNYVKNIITELAKLQNKYKQYMFKIYGPKVVCLSKTEEAEDLEQLINYCIRALRFGELITENPGIIEYWFEYRVKNDKNY